MKKATVLAACMAVILLIATACGKGAASSKADNKQAGTSASGQASSQSGESASGETKSANGGWSIDIDTLTLDGDKITSADFEKNTLTVLNVWATWCSPCVKELPELQKINEVYAEKGVQVVGVLDPSGEPGNSDVLETAKTLLNDAGATYTVIIPDETIINEFLKSMQYFPTTFFLDSEGKVVKTVVGSNSYDDWSGHVDEVLGQLAK